MSEHDLRLAEAAEDAHARQLADAEEWIRLYESDPYWWPQYATEGELTAFAEAVLRALQLPTPGVIDLRIRAIHEARRAAFTATAMRRARVEG